MTSRVPIFNATNEPASSSFVKRAANCPNKGCMFKGSYAEVIKHMNLCELENNDITIDDNESIVMSETTSVMTDNSIISNLDAFDLRDGTTARCILGCGQLIPRNEMENHIQNKCEKRIMACTRSRLGCTWMDEAKLFNAHLEQCSYERLAPVLSKLNDKVTDYQNRCKKYERDISSLEHRLAEEAEIRSNLQAEVRHLVEEVERSRNVTILHDIPDRSGPEGSHGSPGMIETLRTENEMLQESLMFTALPKFNWTISRQDVIAKNTMWSPIFLNGGHKWQLRFVASDFPELYLYLKSKLPSGRGLAIKCRLFILHGSQHYNKHLFMDIRHRYEVKGACGDRMTMKNTADLVDQRSGFIHTDGCLHVGAIIGQIEQFERKGCTIM